MLTTIATLFPLAMLRVSVSPILGGTPSLLLMGGSSLVGSSLVGLVAEAPILLAAESCPLLIEWSIPGSSPIDSVLQSGEFRRINLGNLSQSLCGQN